LVEVAMAPEVLDSSGGPSAAGVDDGGPPAPGEHGKLLYITLPA
jgi:hypothetical protein